MRPLHDDKSPGCDTGDFCCSIAQQHVLVARTRSSCSWSRGPMTARWSKRTSFRRKATKEVQRIWKPRCVDESEFVEQTRRFEGSKCAEELKDDAKLEHVTDDVREPVSRQVLNMAVDVMDLSKELSNLSQEGLDLRQ